MNTTTKKIIFVEGQDEQLLIQNMFEDKQFECIELKEAQSDPTKDLIICNLGSKASFKKSAILSVINRIETDNDKADIKFGILLIRDADDSFKNTKQSLLDLIARINKDRQVATSYFILPDNNSNGQLEDLLLKEIKNDKFGECFISIENCIKKKDPNQNHNKISKLILKSYLYFKTETVGLSRILKNKDNEEMMDLKNSILNNPSLSELKTKLENFLNND